jgi:hypothetical protein
MAAFDFTGDDDTVFAQVRHALEGEEIAQRKWYFADGTERIVENKTFGPQRWIRRVHERGILTPTQLLAVILFALWDFKDPSQGDRIIVSDWNRALTDAMGRGEIRARDRDSLLPLASVDGADWVISLDDADAFVAGRGMAWTCTEIAAHLFNEFFGDASPKAALSPAPPHSDIAEPPTTDGDRAASARDSNAETMPVPLPSPAIAAAFDGLNGWNENEWSKSLGDGRTAWLNKARVTKGRPGSDASTWNPVTIALALRDKNVPWPKLDAVFKKPALRTWRAQWQVDTELLR